MHFKRTANLHFFGSKLKSHQKYLIHPARQRPDPVHFGLDPDLDPGFRYPKLLDTQNRILELRERGHSFKK
jgi:hypothetical protein